MLLSYLKRNANISDKDRSPFGNFWYRNIGSVTPAGVRVTDKVTIQTSTAFACIDLISRTMGMFPVSLYEKRDVDGNINKVVAESHPVHKLLSQKPNDWQTPLEFQRLMMMFVLMRGNAYALLNIQDGEIQGLWPLHPDLVTPILTADRKKLYKVRHADGKKEVVVPGDMMVHLCDFSLDGITGVSRIQAASRAIGLSHELETHGSTLFKNGATLGGAITHPKQLTAEGRAAAKAEFEQYQGAADSHKWMFLDEGMKIETIGMSNDDSQFLETRNFQVEEICRFYRVPPHLVGKMDKASFNNVEQMGIGFVRYTLLPWITMWEQSLDRDLLLPKERGTYYVDMSPDILTRGDAAARAATYNQAWWYTTNEIRERENLNRIEEAWADEIQIPLNRGNPGGAAQNQNNSNNSAGMANDSKFNALIDAAARKIEAKECRFIEVAYKNGPIFDHESLNSFYEKQCEYMKKTIAPFVLDRKAMEKNVDDLISSRLAELKISTSTESFFNFIKSNTHREDIFAMCTKNGE